VGFREGFRKGLLGCGLFAAVVTACVTGSRPAYAQDAATLPAPVATELAYHEPAIDDWPLAQAPEGYHWAPKPRPWLMNVGLSIFALAYFPAGSVASVAWYTNNQESYGWQLIPVAGSFIELGFARDAGVKTLLVMDGALQGVGLVIAASSLLFPSRHLERDAPTAARLTVLPFVARGAEGMQLGGSF
jgi:hypothetical protein